MFTVQSNNKMAVVWFIVIIILATVYVVHLYLKNYFRAVFLALQLKGPATLPLIGNGYLMNKSRELEYIANNIYKYGPIVRFWISVLPTFIIYEPRHLKILLGSSKLSRKADYYKFLHTFLGQGLTTSDGEKWKQNRRIMQPLFNVNVLDIFLSNFKEMADKFCDELIKDSGRDMKLSNLINDFVVQITLKSVLGIESNGKTPFRNCPPFLLYRMLKPWFLLESFFHFTAFGKKEEETIVDANKFVEKILKSRLKNKERSSSSSSTVCFLDMFIELAKHNPQFSHDDIIKECCTLILAGQDSVGTALSFALYFLAAHKDIQDKVFNELESIMGKDITLEQLNALEFLEQCIKETLRLTPPIPIIARKLQKDLKLDQYTIPAGANIIISPFATQRLAHFYSNPQQFDPNRFHKDNSSKLHPFAFLPFSLGQRNCIGDKYAMLEMKVVIATILKKFQLELCKKGHANLELLYKVTLRAKGGIWVRFTKRS